MISAIILGGVLLVIGLILRFTKVNRNSLFGYRTYLSMKNDENWSFANKMFAKHAIGIGAICILVSTGLLLSSVQLNSGYFIFFPLTLILFSIIMIESNLRKFDKSSKNL